METTRTTLEIQSGPGGSGLGPFAGGDADGSVIVAHGPYSESLPVAGMAISEIRARFADLFDLHPMSQAFVNGTEVSDDTRVAPGQLLSFMHRSGEKGVL